MRVSGQVQVMEAGSMTTEYERTKNEDHIEKKIKQLEEEIKSLREPLEKTLFDVREVLSTLENPFNYITILLGSEVGSKLSQLQNADKLTDGSKNQNNLSYNRVTEEVVTSVENNKQYVNFREVKGEASNGRRDLVRFINIVATVSIMLELVGKDNLLNLVNMVAWKGLISKELADSIKEAVELYLRGELGTRFDPSQTINNTVGNTLVVLYLLSKLAKEDNDPLMVILVTAFDKNRRGY